MELFTPWFDKTLPLSVLKEQCPFVDAHKSDYVKCFHNVHKVQEFDWMRYIKDHPNLQNMNIQDEWSAYNNWIDGGRKGAFILETNDVYNGFLWTEYLQLHSDLGKHGIRSELEAMRHWINHGRGEKRIVVQEMALISEAVRDAFIGKLMSTCITETEIVKEFDWNKYLTKYSDVVNAGFNDEKRAYEHWALHGCNENRAAYVLDSNEKYRGFPWNNYLVKNPDLTHLTTELQCYNHWVDFGRKEGRKCWEVAYNMSERKIFKDSWLNAKFADLAYRSKVDLNYSSGIGIAAVNNDEFMKYDDVLMVLNLPDYWHGEYCNYQLLKSLQFDYVFFHNIEKINYKKYNYIIIDSLLLNASLRRPSSNAPCITHRQLLETIKLYFDTKIIILSLHDLHWWSTDGFRTIAVDMNNKSELKKKNSFFYQNIELYKKLNVRYYISLYNCDEFHNIVAESPFIKSSYINYYPCFKEFNNIRLPKQYNITLYGSVTSNIYPLRHKIYCFLKKNIIKQSMVVENVSAYNGESCIKEADLNHILNRSWLAVSTKSFFSYYLRKYNEIGNTSCAIIGNISKEIKKVIGLNYIYINEACNEEYFKKLVDYYLDHKAIICYINYNCNVCLKDNSANAYMKRGREIMGNIKYNDPTGTDYINYNNVCNNLDNNNYYYIQTKVNPEPNTILVSSTVYDTLTVINCENNTYYYKIDDIAATFIGDYYKIIKYKIIDQMYISPRLSDFSLLQQKYLNNNNNIINYEHNDIPSFFYGIQSSLEIMNNHTDDKVIIFTQDDFDFMVTNPDTEHGFEKNIAKEKNMYIITETAILSNYLKTKNIRHILYPNFLKDKDTQITLYTEVFYKCNINYYFDKIYVLNLKKDITKKKMLEHVFDKLNINNYTFYEAIYGKEDKNLSDKYKTYSEIPYSDREKTLGRKLIGSVGVLANLISVKNIIIDAKKNNYKRILFMEDDVIFHKEFNALFTDITSRIVSDWKILYLGCQNIITNTTKIMNNIYDCNINSSGGWSFGIDSSVYDELINECNKEDLPFDSGPLYYLRHKYPTKCKVMYPNLCICDISTSSIRDDKRTMEMGATNFRWNLNDYEL